LPKPGRLSRLVSVGDGVRSCQELMVPGRYPGGILLSLAASG